ncbi:MAG: 2-amino-4-hydroxy-6-hydroxymethyldihydropteridine diphosphokinase [Candidatus Fonsibacter sp.]
MKVVIALGSNLGDRTEYLNNAIKLLKKFVLDSKVSTYLETEPVGEIPQPNYLNAVLVGNTSLNPSDLLNEMQKIETDLGRVREKKWDARTIDLDLIVYGDQLINTKSLVVPHPFAHKRDFVLKPWIEIDPDGEIPGVGAIKLLI